MQTFIRKISCDCCGTVSEDEGIIKYKVVKLAHRNYDLCPECQVVLNMKRFDYELALIEGFYAPAGRELEDGDK